MSKNEKIKNRPLQIVTSEEELSNLQKNRDKLVEKLGQKKYDRLVEQLENHINNTRKQPKSASPPSEL